MNFIQKQLQEFVEEQKNPEHVCQRIERYFEEHKMSKEQEKEVVGNCLYQIVTFYSTNNQQTTKSTVFNSLIQLFVTLLKQTDIN